MSTPVKTRTTLWAKLTPKVIGNTNTQNPWMNNLVPAPFIPVKFIKRSDRGSGVEYFVFGEGRPLSLCRYFGAEYEGEVTWAVEAGWGEDVIANGLVYGADHDVDNLTEDLVTGEPVAAGGASYTAQEVAEALLGRGLVSTNDATDAGATAANLFEGGTLTPGDISAVIRAFVSEPVGFAQYDCWAFLGRVRNSTNKFLNWIKQHKIALITYTQAEVAHATAGQQTIAVDGTAAAAAYDAARALSVPEWYDAAAMATHPRYSALGVTATSDVVALSISTRPLAKNLDATPLESDGAGLLVREVKKLSLLTGAGDYWLDHARGVVFVHGTTWTGLAASVTFDFYSYSGAGLSGVHVPYAYAT